LRLAKMLGGSIDVEGRVGEGSTFTLRLPVRARRR
jgi:signal transduction histidine kinase